MKQIKFESFRQKELKKIFERSGDISKEIDSRVMEIIEKVKLEGDKAILELTKKFDKVELQQIKVDKGEIIDAENSASEELVEALKVAISNQFKFQSGVYKKESGVISTMEGINVWREVRPIEKVGLYVPGGRARYPSSIVMVGVPAVIAGCKQLTICTPPDTNGNVPGSTLTAVSVLREFFKSKGKTDFSIDVYKVGGAQAIASMAFGTETIPKSYKIFGAGNSYVTVAKQKVFGKVDIDMPAGPSEVMVLADSSADPEWIAADLISQCEHGEESAAVLVSDSKEFIEKVVENCYLLAEKLTTKETILKSLSNYGAGIEVDNWRQAIEIVNEYAPEHLEINTTNYKELASKVVNAGSVFLGSYATEPAGDYATGSNHVLPTNGYAKAFEGLSVDAFIKQVEFQELTKDGLEKILKTVNVLAYEEGLPAHAEALNIRFK